MGSEQGECDSTARPGTPQCPWTTSSKARACSPPKSFLIPFISCTVLCAHCLLSSPGTPEMNLAIEHSHVLPATPRNTQPPEHPISWEKSWWEEGGGGSRRCLLPSSAVRRLRPLQRAMKCTIPSHKSLIIVIIHCHRVQNIISTQTSSSFCTTRHLHTATALGSPSPPALNTGTPAPGQDSLLPSTGPGRRLLFALL